MNIEKYEKSLKNNKIYPFFIVFLIFFTIFSSFLLFSCNQKNIAVEEIKLSHTELSLFLSQRQKLYVEVLPDKASGFTIDFSSSAPKIVSVNEKGYVEAKKYGEAIITARVRNTDIKAECYVEVNDGQICSFSVKGDYKVYYEGQTFDKNSLKVYAVYESGKETLLAEEDYTLEIPEILTLESEIKVTYGNLKPRYYYPIVMEDFVEQIEITTPPAKTEYIIGEEFDTSGMEVSLIYASGKKELTQDYTIESSTAKFKQTSLTVIYDEDITASIPISTKAQITVNTISALQTAINEGYTSIMLAEGSYNTTSQITIDSKENILIYGQSSKTSINGYNIIAIKITGECGSITLADLTLTSIGDTPAEYQIDLSTCTAQEINLQNVNYSNLAR